MTAVEILVSIFVIIGALFNLLAAIGIVRLQDVYSRIHAASKSATLGVMSVMLGTFLYFLLGQGEYVGKILLTILFVFITAPAAGLMMGRSAYNVGVPLWKNSVQDDLKEVKRSEKKH
ncbi:cation:proton antiporter [Alkalihalobacillus alcalophilus ATCC 27647 = CGMCC 1.3604]|uniref:Cation:proton antiporter n=1 Tax=Alkalihalobacillus alcalophilus ATCC 27647 = CGMCC 1.3604 TaxID=1218173 RepID=A0A094WJW5_ALKAL|nr:monovalent cation/H(+) antiporter subunit G [Alkalihalobacillus alcalophilus]KGA97131.1 monovalent cation/H+ antiporter subunit G [Alkalihalobacillus alcalophilus ATCC 27647 = CGMCC 1.3604]MED1560597.1 monovalent cation/H(+) antiporter subunit G [Alkalihalobacillus alcalophilus]THG89073.1 cation:proton antiporter [Alkalihalobacillus alcalophilus ATCC 27647 = CGMCC 1.3604]